MMDAMRTRSWLLTNGRAAGFALAMLASGGCATIDHVTGERVQNMYSLQEDVALGRNVQQEILAEMKKGGARINGDPARVAQLNEMMRRIAAVSHLPDLPYEVTLFETNIVNAAAAPGGQLVVFSGLYNPKDGLVQNENELAAVMAHEIAHVTCRHTTESLTRRAPVDLLLLAGALYAEAKDREDLAVAMGVAFIAYEGFYLPRYSREDEAEADAVGLMYMAKAGYDPRAAPALWKRVAEKEGRTPSWLRWMSSHPSHEDRHRALEKQLPAALVEYEKALAARP